MAFSTVEPLPPSGRIRLDEEMSRLIVKMIDDELVKWDGIRHEWSMRGDTDAAHAYNVGMRKLRRTIREIQRMRAEMGWDDVELSDLAARAK